MHLPDGLIAMGWVVTGWLFASLVTGYAIWRAPWGALRKSPHRLNLVIASVLALAALWSLRANVLPGLSLHFLGLAAVTLVIGPWLALLSGALALFAYAALGLSGWQGIGLEFLFMVLVPVLTTYGISRASQHWLPANFFIYLFVDVFLSAILGAIVVGLLVAGFVTLIGLYDASTVWRGYVAMLPLQAFPEGVVNGMVMTAFALLVPQWVISFDDERYITGK